MTERPFSYEIADDFRRLVLRGDLDEIATIEVRNTLSTMSEGLTKDVTVDLSDLDLLPSSAVGVIASAQDGAKRKGATIRFVAADGTVAARVLAVCGLDYSES